MTSSDSIIKKYYNKEALSGQVFLIMTGFNCNNNCLMCSVRPKGLFHSPRPKEDILKDIKDGKKQNYQRIEFTGGEPTLRGDILDLIAEANKIGYQEIAISTNARMLSIPKYLDKLIENGLNRVTTTLYGPNKNIHEVITRTPGSFQQTINGIRNVIKNNIPITVNTVLFSLTAPYLKQTGLFINYLGVKHWTLLDLIPDGYALEKYDFFSLSPSKIRSAFNSIVPILDKFELVNIFDFPFCLIPENIFEHQNCNILAAKGRTKIIKQVGYKPNRFKKESNVYYDIHKIRSPKCAFCKYNKECGGFWKSYLNNYDGDLIKPIKSKIIY